MLRRHHDVGGLDAGPIERHDHAHAPWENKLGALTRLLLAKKLITLDELRRSDEEIGPDAYDRLSYFERWITGLANLLLEKQLISVAELGRAMESVRQAATEAGRP